MEYQTLRAALLGLSAYRELLDEPVLLEAQGLLSALAREDGEGALSAYAALFAALAQEGYEGIGDWLWDALRFSPSLCARKLADGTISAAMRQALVRDVDVLTQLAALDCSALLEQIAALLPVAEIPVTAGMPRWSSRVPFSFPDLEEAYRRDGAGPYARHRAFLFEEGELIPIADPDCPQPDELLGYELQRAQVVDNTRGMLEGKKVNNVLLFGDGGTGKSATVKSLLYQPGFADLRLIEVQKDGLVHIPALMRTLGGQRQKFILFIDDLAFDQDDRTYSALKTILEGGLEKRPANVAVYATSNRRHLVRQTFSDRAGDEVDTFETISEKTALAERFGLRIPYLTMNKADFLALVDHLARLEGVEMEPSLLHAKAMEWEIRHAGRTPRSARQFIASL